MLANKEIFIISDGDSAAVQAKKSYQKDQGYRFNHWYTFTDLGSNKKTIEDFIADRNIFKAVLEEMGKTDIEIPANPENGIIAFLSSLIKNKEEKQQFKVLLAQRLTCDSIAPDYYQLLTNLKEKIQNETQERC